VTHRLPKSWRPILSRNRWAIASLSIAVLLCADLLHFCLAIWGGQALRPIAMPMPASAPTGGHSRRDAASIIVAHLFGSAGEDPLRDSAKAPPSAANLVLAGVIATGDPRQGMAIISDAGPSKLYAVGGRVSGATLYSVYVDHVVLDRSGRLETLSLPRQLSRTAAVQSRSAAANAVPPPPVRELADFMGVGSAVMAAGKLHAFRVYPARNRAAFNGFGLRMGDLVIAVNGTPLDDQDHSNAQEAFDAIKGSGSATLTIMRNGQPQDIIIDVSHPGTDAG
jgi:general secretion pathway protein C